MGLFNTAASAASAFTPWGAVAAGIGGLAGLAKTAIGAVQTGRANKEFKSLLANRPVYEIPKEYEDVLSTYQKLAAGKMPGFDEQIGRIGQSAARATESAKKGAISSTAYQQSVQDVYQKELEALRDLDVRSQDYQSYMVEKAQGAKLGLAGEKSQAWNINKNIPWQTEMNRLSEQRITGQQNLFSGLGDVAGQFADFAGTSIYQDMLEKLYPQNTTT
jgi:hypothetical protein